MYNKEPLEALRKEFSRGELIRGEHHSAVKSDNVAKPRETIGDMIERGVSRARISREGTLGL